MTHFPFLHLNIQLLKQNFGLARIYYMKSTVFSIFLFQRTWSDNDNVINSLYFRGSYTNIHQVQNGQKGGSICTFVYNSLFFKRKDDLSINCLDTKSKCLKSENKGWTNNIFKVMCTYLLVVNSKCLIAALNVLSKTTQSNKILILTGGLNLNFLDLTKTNLFKVFSVNILLLINKPSRVNNSVL